MKTFLKTALAAAALTAAGLSQASSYSFNFPTASSSVVSSFGLLSPTEIGYFWSVSRGDMVSQAYAASGVFGTTSLELDLNVTRNVLSTGNSVQWDVLVNGTDVGDWAWSSANGTGLTHLSLSFAAVTGEFSTLALVVKNEVPSGDGSIALGLDTRGTVAAIPEPETYALMLAGLAGIGALVRRRKA